MTHAAQGLPGRNAMTLEIAIEKGDPKRALGGRDERFA